MQSVNSMRVISSGQAADNGDLLFSTEFGVGELHESEFLMQFGYVGFSDFWQLPEDYVEEVNIRRGGWSGVAKISLLLEGIRKSYFVKRQENQIRYSLSKPFGALTYKYEIEAIGRNRKLFLPSSNIVCWGIQKARNSYKGLIVTEAIECPSLQDLSLQTTDWDAYLPTLRLFGEQLLRMHRFRIQHGALFPKHIFIDPKRNKIKLIDFERSRMRFTSESAVSADLQQFIRRSGCMPFGAVEAILEPYKA